MIFFQEGDFIPTSGSTCSSTHLSESASINWMSFTCYIPPEIPEEEDDAIHQLRQRKLRYGPFHLYNLVVKFQDKKNSVSIKPKYTRQIMKQPFKIGQR